MADVFPHYRDTDIFKELQEEYRQEANGPLEHKAYGKPVAVAPNNVRSIDINALADGLAAASALTPFTAAQFALEMIMGVPQLSFTVNPAPAK